VKKNIIAMKDHCMEKVDGALNNIKEGFLMF